MWTALGYQELPEFDAQRKKLLESQIKEYPPLYLSDLTYAMEHRNADAYLDSRKLNLDCKKAIEEAIDSHFDGIIWPMKLRQMWWKHTGQNGCLLCWPVPSSTSDQTGGFQKRLRNGRIASKSRRISAVGWISIADYVVTSHPAVMDGFIGLARKEMGEQEQEKQAGQIGPETKGLLDRGAFWHLAHGRSEGNRRGRLSSGWSMTGMGIRWQGLLWMQTGSWWREDLEHGFDDGAMEAITEYLYEKVPEPFIKQFYVVNDAYGDKAEREYQYFENLDEAIQAYHLLPNHLDKRLGMESREPVTSRMTLLKCENGIENVEDVKKASLDENG